MLLTPTVGVPPMPMAPTRSTMHPGLRLTSLPGSAPLSQRPKVIEAFEPVFEASPYTMVANVTGSCDPAALHQTDDGLPMGMLLTAAIAEAVPSGGRAARCQQCGDRMAPHAIPEAGGQPPWTSSRSCAPTSNGEKSEAAWILLAGVACPVAAVWWFWSAAVRARSRAVAVAHGDARALPSAAPYFHRYAGADSWSNCSSDLAALRSGRSASAKW